MARAVRRERGLRRVAVVGTSCSGKTVFARRLAAGLGRPHIELDALHWLPDWVERPDAEFRALVEGAVAGGSWVADGNYSVVRDIVWGRATDVIWLDYSLPVVFRRALSRTVRRVRGREEIFHGNKESWRRSFLSHDSILFWVLHTHGRNRRRYRELRQRDEWRDLRFQSFRRSAEADVFLARRGC